MIPQHNRRDLENVFENVLRAIAAQQRVKRVRHRERDLRAKRFQRLDAIANIDIVAGDKAPNIELEDFGAERPQLFRHFDGKVVIDSAEPGMRWKSSDDPETLEWSGGRAHRSYHHLATRRTWCIANAGSPRARSKSRRTI